jgi:alpha-galactosidase
MKGLGDWIKSTPLYSGSSENFLYGLYSCRGTCQCGTGTYSAPGSNGFEAIDTEWMVAAGASYLKIDSCCGNQDHAVAFSDYAKWRDAMNASGTKHGTRVWFSLCGWESWYSPPDPSVGYLGGASLGNSWRIAGDGSGWGPLTNCMNTQAAAAPYAGIGGWPDPDLLIGPQVYVGGQTDEQARAQFTMWSIFPTNLLISQNMLQWSAYALETYSNDELIAINQDPLGIPAQRIVGNDLPFPCQGGSSSTGFLASVVAAECDATNEAQQWSFSNGLITSRKFAGVIDDVNCASDDGSPVAVYKLDNGQGTCNGKNQIWNQHADGTLVNAYSNKCLDVYDFAGPAVDVWTCNGGPNQNFTIDSVTGLISTSTVGGKPKMCLQATEMSCSNVWGRQLSDGYALAFINNDSSSPSQSISCDESCFSKLLNGTSVNSLKVRDLWAHEDIATLSPPFSFSFNVNGSGFASAFKLTPS